MDDFFENDTDFCITKSICQSVKPHKVVVTSGEPEKFYDCLESMTETSEGSAELAYEFNIIIIPRSNQSYIQCIDRIHRFGLATRTKNGDHVDCSAYLGSWINLSSACTMKALGILLFYLDEHDPSTTSWTARTSSALSFLGFLNL
ncbi:hypothetical protein QAD02_008367 [Eretmocerus hayati]|uniref:Uncharacterized protein n=1 Tax=Eretmocerus hayati TaxID=131215 RepID=A0ACC2NAN8_9HYME|nr:hypothetical protein QAD02_008367 [Eretmocerus hayati]